MIWKLFFKHFDFFVRIITYAQGKFFTCLINAKQSMLIMIDFNIIWGRADNMCHMTFYKRLDQFIPTDFGTFIV